MGAAALKASGDTAAYGDNIDKMSQKLGMSAEAYQEWDAIMQHSGTSIDSMTSAMKTLATQAEKDGAAFETIGLSLDEISGMSQEELFSATITALQNMEEGTERTAAASKLLGKGAIELGALLNTSAEDTEAMRQRVHELGGVMSNEAVKSAAAYQDSLQDMQTSINSIGKNLTSNFLPGLTQVMDGLTEIFAGGDGGSLIEEGINSLASNINEKLPQVIAVGEKILSSLISAISDNLPSIMQAGIDALSALGQGIMGNLPQLAQAATEIILMLTRFVIEALPDLIRAGIQIISTIAQGIAEALPELIPAIVDVILEIVDVLTQPDNIIMLLDAAIAIVIGLADGIMKSLPKLLERMPEIIVNVVGALIAAIPELIEGVLDLGYAIITGIVDGAMSVMDNLGEIWESVKEAFSGAWDKIKETWAGVGDWFGEKWSDIKSRFAETKEWFSNKFKEAKEAAQKHWEKIGDWFGKRKEDAQKAWNGFDTWMGNHFGEVWEAIKKPFKKFKEFFDGLVQIIKDVFSGNKSLLEVGQDIVDGIWNGIKGAAETFTRNVKEFFGNIVQGVKDFLGIHSPSKLFKEQIGENIALGVAEGIDAKADKAIKAADDLAKDVYSRSKDWADKQTKYMELSLDDQIELWETIQGQFIETSKQYSDAEEKLYDLRKKKRDEEAKEAERQTNEYVANIKSGLDKIKKLWDDYKTVYDKEYSSINGAFGLFASPNDRQYVEGVDLMENMRKQIRDINQFYDGLDQLYERGVGKDMVDEIRAMGPGAINELVGLLDLSDQQLEEYYDMYKHKADVAKYWTDRYTDNLKTIAEASITGMFDGMNVELNDALDAAYDWGEDYVKELAAGIEAGTLSYLNGSGAMIAGRLSGAENWSGDMHVTVNAAVGQTVEAVAQEVERRILNAFANRKQVYA